jgi:DNA-directed RNA polymerase specialized sigma24 family protein
MTAEKIFVLSKDSLDGLLARLDPDRARAGEKYETLRLGLIRFFEWRGASLPVEHTDETLDRVAQKLLHGEEIRDIHAFAIGVARFVYLEVVKQQAAQQTALRKWTAPPPQGADEPPTVPDERSMACARRCLKTLPGAQARLLLDYYRDDKAAKIANRQRLAEQQGVSLNTLRMRMCRIRAQLEECVGDCVTKFEIDHNR